MWWHSAIDLSGDFHTLKRAKRLSLLTSCCPSSRGRLLVGDLPTVLWVENINYSQKHWSSSKIANMKSCSTSWNLEIQHHGPDLWSHTTLLFKHSGKIWINYQVISNPEWSSCRILQDLNSIKDSGLSIKK